jgi:uncharacterized membrane protein
MFCIALIYAFASWLTYGDSCREQWWYVPIGAILGAVLSILWFVAAKVLGDKEKILVFSLYVDFIMVLCYYMIPFIFYGVKMDLWSGIGLLLMFLGFAVLKVRQLIG